MKKVLITGASGLLGANLMEQLSEDFDVYGTSSTAFNDSYNEKYKVFDLRSDDYSQLFDWIQPDIIIHSAALINGNYCQNNPEEAFLINAFSCYKLAKQSPDHTKIIYISTDAVFSSDLHLAKESDVTKPENNYGKSKELGEFLLLNSIKEIVVVRTTIVGLNLNKKRSSFVEWIIKSVNNSELINLFSDVLFTPISVWRLGLELKRLINEGFKKQVYHIAGSEVVTKYDFGFELIKSINGDLEYINKGRIVDFTDRAKRSNDQSLSCELFETDYSVKLPSLRETINELKVKYDEQY